MYNTLLGLLAALALALLGVGLTFSASTDAPADFRFVNGTEARTLDPQLMTGQPEGRIARALFEGLTRLDARSLRPAPGMAERWEISDDRETYVFHLRTDARWSDGTPVTAHDFVYSWKRLLDPALGAEYAYILYPVREAEAYHAYAAHAERLAGPIAEALAALRAAHPQGVEAPTWQRFLAEQRVGEALSKVRDPLLRDALAARGGRLGPERLERIAGALRREAGRRRQRAAEAAQTFGVRRGVFARDARTLVVELEAPTPYFLEISAFYSTLPAPRHVVERHPGDWFLPGKIVSNGPFRLESWRVNDRIRLVRSESYWGRDEVGMRVIDALPVENETTALNLYLTGAVDWLPSSYPSDLVDQLRPRPDFYSGPGMIVYFYRLNCSRPPLDDRRVREALNLAVDRELIVREVLGLGQIPATRIVPPGMPGYEPPAGHGGLDVERARALLAEAGHPGGRGIPELGILYNTNEVHKKVAEVIADQLRRHLGIRARAYNQEWQSYLATVVAEDYDIARAGWIGDYLDPNTFLDLWVSNGGNNRTGWSSPLYDRLIESAANPEALARDDGGLFAQLAEPGRARGLARAVRDAPSARARAGAAARLRMQLLREAETLLVQREFPVLPIYFYVVSGLVKPEVGGFYSELELEDGSRAPNLLDIHPLRDLRPARAAAGGRS